MWLKLAEYIKEYKIKVVFEDGTERVINIKPFLNKSTNPLIKQYLDLNLFRKFHVEYGALCWEGNVFDISPEAIYRGDFDDVKTKKLKRKSQDKEIV